MELAIFGIIAAIALFAAGRYTNALPMFKHPAPKKRL